MRRFFYCRSTRTTSSLGLLELRLVMGAAFVVHGWSKIQNPTGWMGDALPGFVQVLPATAEFGGGLLLILGLLTPLAALGILCTMIGALLLVHFPRGDAFVGGESTFELPLTYLSAALLFLLAGPGRFSADYAIFGSSPAPHDEERRAASSEGSRSGVAAS